jgi:rhodanese-related sulfurtransferase
VSKILNKVLVFLLIAGLAFLGGYYYLFNKNQANQFEYVDLETGKKLILVNVLDLDQYQDCHIKGSVHVPFDQVESFAQKLDLETELVVYCSNYMCAASGKAAELLKQKGFNSVWAYEAGMADWYQKNLPVVGSCKATYLKAKNEPLFEQEESGDLIITTQQLRSKLGL